MFFVQLHKSPSMRQTSAPRTPSGRTSVAYPSTPMSKVDELYSRMSNDELKQLAAMNNVPSFDKIPFATPAMKPSDPRHFDQHGPSSRYPQGGGGGGGGPRDPSFSGASRPPWAASTSAPQQPPWEKWQPRQTPREWESMDDIRAQSAPLYREQFRGQVPTQHHEHGPRRRSNSEASASHDPFGLDASGPLGDGYQGYGGSSFNNPFDDYPGPPGMGGGNDSLDQLNPDDIFGTGDDSFDDANDWPPYPPQPQQQTGPSDPRNAPWSGYGSRGRSRTTSESSIPFGVQGETFPRGPPQQDPRRQRRNSMMHPRGGPPQYPYQQQQQQQQQWERQQGRMRSNSGPPRPSYPPRHPGGPGGQFGEANHDQSWRQFRPPDQYRQQQMRGPPPPQRNLISRDDIEQARFQASRIRQERHREEERRQYEHPLANQPPYQQPQQQQQGRPPSPPPWHQRPGRQNDQRGLISN